MTTNTGDEIATESSSAHGFSYAYHTSSGASPGETGADKNAAPFSQTPRHQRIVLRLAVPLASLVEARNLGSVYIAPLDVVIEPTPRRSRQPDLFFVSRTRMRPEDEPEGALEIGPDLVIEVLEGAESRRGFIPALTDYTAIGVTEVWLVSPQSETIEVLCATTDCYETAGVHGRGAVIVSQTVPGYTVNVDDIFA